MNKNTLISILVAIGVGGAAGYAVASYQYAAKLNTIREAFPAPAELTSIVGTIQSVSGDIITLKSVPSMNPLEELPAVSTITVTSATTIEKLEPKAMNVLAQQMDAYQKAIQKSEPAGTSTASAINGVLTPPLPFLETPLALADLKAGDMITVEAGKDIKMETSFEAVKISVTGSAPVLTAPADAGQGSAPIVGASQTRTDGSAPPVGNAPLPTKK